MINTTRETLGNLLLVAVALYFLAGAVVAGAPQAEAANVQVLNGAFVNASTTVSTTTSTSVLATSTSRNFARITNDSDIPVYLAIGTAAAKGKGIRLAAGESFTIDESNLLTGAINAIASSTAISPAANLSVSYKNGNL